MSDKTYVDLLNAYLAVESLLNSRYMSAQTRERAVDTLRNLNHQFAELLKLNELHDDSRSQAAD